MSYCPVAVVGDGLLIAKMKSFSRQRGRCPRACYIRVLNFAAVVMVTENLVEKMALMSSVVEEATFLLLILTTSWLEKFHDCCGFLLLCEMIRDACWPNPIICSTFKVMFSCVFFFDIVCVLSCCISGTDEMIANSFWCLQFIRGGDTLVKPPPFKQQLIINIPAFDMLF